MKRTLIKTQAFVRTARQLLNRHPQFASILQATLHELSENAFDAKLRTHKLKGEMAGSWSCSASYNLRIVFEFVKHEDSEAILLQTIGTHDEVY